MAYNWQLNAGTSGDQRSSGWTTHKLYMIVRRLDGFNPTGADIMSVSGLIRM